MIAGTGHAQDALVQGDFMALKRTGEAEIVEVVNPLTVLLSTGKVARLAGIDIPDYHPENAGHLSVTARDILRDMLGGQRASIYQTRKKDTGRVNRMGHEIVHLERHKDKAWAQGVLVSLGLARARTSKRNPEMAAQLLALESAARNEKSGLWGEERYGILTPEDLQDEERAGELSGAFVIVEGVIQSVSLKQNRIYMNFGKNWRSDFTVSIAPQDKRSFSKAQLDPLGWGGKRVRVRGILKSINGPYIEIDHPEALEFPDEKKVSPAQTSKPDAAIKKVQRRTLNQIARPPSTP